MRTQEYRVARGSDGWSIKHNGSMEGSYVTKEAAFEAAVAAASGAIRAGEGVLLSVEPSRAESPNLSAD